MVNSIGQRRQFAATRLADDGGIGCGVGSKEANARFFDTNGCVRSYGMVRGDMNVARSDTHGGASASGSSSTRLPANRCSRTSFRF